MKLSENPFAVLGASPADSRKKLADLADEAALLGGAASDEALAVLMQMNKRLTAELSWFPGTDPETVEAFLQYAGLAASRKPGPLPSLEGLGTPLAQANALAALFDLWPAGRPEYLTGLCAAMDRILSKVTAEETLAAVNADRQAGGWEQVPDALALSGPLDERLRELSSPLVRRMEKIGTDAEVTGILDSLYSTKYPDFDTQGTVARTLADGYYMRVHDREEAMRKTVREKLDVYMQKPATITDLNAIKPDLEAWCALTAPMRKAPGEVKREAQSLCHDMRECIVNYVNHAPATSEKTYKTIPTANGSKMLTITYQSRSAALTSAKQLSSWLINLFPEQTEQAERLWSDMQQLESMIRAESDSVMRAVMNAH